MEQKNFMVRVSDSAVLYFFTSVAMVGGGDERRTEQLHAGGFSS